MAPHLNKLECFVQSLVEINTAVMNLKNFKCRRSHLKEWLGPSLNKTEFLQLT